MKHVITFILAVASFRATCQMPEQPVVILPFESIMYKSMIDKELAQGTKFNWQEIHQQVRDAIMQEMMLRFKQHWQVRAVGQHDSLHGALLEAQIYQFVTYQATPVVTNTGKHADKGVKLPQLPKKKQANNQPEPGTQIKNGEIVTVRETREMAMKTIVVDADGYKQALQVLKCKSALFISQLDLEMIPGSYGMDDRVATIHFTLLNQAGEEINVGKFRHHFSSTGLNLQTFNSLIVRQMIAGFSEMLIEQLSTP